MGATRGPDWGPASCRGHDKAGGGVPSRRWGEARPILSGSQLALGEAAGLESHVPWPREQGGRRDPTSWGHCWPGPTLLTLSETLGVFPPFPDDMGAGGQRVGEMVAGPPCLRALCCPGCCPFPCASPPAPTLPCSAPRHTGRTKTCKSLLHFAPATLLQCPSHEVTQTPRPQVLQEAPYTPSWAASVPSRVILLLEGGACVPGLAVPALRAGPGTQRERTEAVRDPLRPLGVASVASGSLRAGLAGPPMEEAGSEGEACARSHVARGGASSLRASSLPCPAWSGGPPRTPRLSSVGLL